MPTLKITATQAGQAVTVDLSGYLKLNEGDGTDPYDPAYTQRVFARSLLKEGATLALQQLVEKEQTWPLLIGPFNTQSAMAVFIQQLNQMINTPGAVVTWQDDGLSQPTYFDLLSGELQVEYSYRKAQKAYTPAKLLLFSQPLGRTAGPRPYAAASGVGPLLMISPYASGGALAIGASTQAGVAGFGGQQQGASSGVFYGGAPSLAGDAPALLQVSYVGPLPNTASATGIVPYAAVSLLPDSTYQPLIGAAAISNLGGITVVKAQTAVGSQYLHAASPPVQLILTPLQNGVPGASSMVPPLSWAGLHRLFAIARASQAPGWLQTQQSPNVSAPTTATVYPGDWAPYDLGTFAVRASETGAQPATIAGGGRIEVRVNSGASPFIDVAGFVMLPDNATWYLNPQAIQASQYGYPNIGIPIGSQAPAIGNYTNSLALDDVLGDQFIPNNNPSVAGAPSVGAIVNLGRITPFTRGLVPRPDPKSGLPILAILGIAQWNSPSSPYIPGASWANPQNLSAYAQVDVLERTRYVLP